MSKQSIEERLREKLARVLVGYDKRYTVASLSIILDKMMVSIKKELSQARREEREKVKDILVKLKEKDKGWTGFPPTPMRFGEYEKIQASKDFGYDKAIGDVLDQLKLKVKEEKWNNQS